jgi:flagellar biosynthesis/type III secretory pathway M-ring protein FliF/YscJ
MDSWDIALLVIAAYVAVVALVRLMIRERNRLAHELLQQAEQERRKRKTGTGSEPDQRPNKAA